MVIEMSKNIAHPPCTKANKMYSEEELQDIMVNLMKENGIDAQEMSIDDNGTLKLNGTPNLNLHRLMLEVEKLGLNIKYSKKTLIEVC